MKRVILPTILMLTIASNLFGQTHLSTPSSDAHARKDDCRARLESDTLIIENSFLRYKWLWNGGEIIPLSLHNIQNDSKLTFANRESDCRIAQKGDDFIENLSFEINNVESDEISVGSLEVEIINQYAEFQQRRKIRIFPNTPAISFDFAFKYKNLNTLSTDHAAVVDGVENRLNDNKPASEIYLVDYHFNQKHWKYQNVEFRDMTDTNNNLVSEQNTIPYNKATQYSGNLVWAENLLTGFKFFVLKEAPNSSSQVAYSGYDFLISNRRFSIPISGVEASSDGDDFISAYTITLGMTDSLTNGRSNLRKYLKHSAPYSPLTHDMVLMNTWGDRGQDGRICEQFVLDEIAKASSLGITHFQIDDGWQQGASANSSTNNGNKSWDSWSQESWAPHSERFPNGLSPIIEEANQHNIKLGLWFNPSKANDYTRWESDAQIVINLFKSYGIKYFKIDGVSIPTKRAAQNFEKFLTRVKEESNGEVFFNLDLTAGIRGGYFSYRYAGNLFLENRYTDFQNYYPFHTLRNLWMLSQYYPPELLQIEFLNKWRNRYNYPREDIFAPSHYDIDYLFATTMAAQPLAWCEATRLPAEADDLAPLIEKYKSIQSKFHSGVILPIGEEPNGRTWCGFQSIVDSKSGYVLIFREASNADSARIKLYTSPSSAMRFTLVAGAGKTHECTADNEGRIEFNLTAQQSFALYKYEIR